MVTAVYAEDEKPEDADQQGWLLPLPIVVAFERVSHADVRIDQLNIDTGYKGYQRLVKPAKIHRMVKYFDPFQLEPVVLSRRADGTLWVINGHHRVEACRIRGVKMVHAMIIDGMTREEEADLFVKLATNKTSIGPHDRHRAGLVAQDPKALLIERIVSEEGFRFTTSSLSRDGAPQGPPHPIHAIYVLQQMVERREEGRAERDIRAMLGLIRDAWGDGDTTFAVQNEMLHGIDRFLTTYAGVMKYERLIEVLREVTPKLLKNEGDALASAECTARRVGICRKMVQRYNVGLARGMDRLDAFARPS